MVTVPSLCQIDLWPAHSEDTVDVLIGQAISAGYVTYISLALKGLYIGEFWINPK